MTTVPILPSTKKLLARLEQHKSKLKPKEYDRMLVDIYMLNVMQAAMKEWKK